MIHVVHHHESINMYVHWFIPTTEVKYMGGYMVQMGGHSWTYVWTSHTSPYHTLPMSHHAVRIHIKMLTPSSLPKQRRMTTSCQPVHNLYISWIWSMNICEWIWWNSRSCMSWCLQDWNSIFSHYTHAIARTMAKAMHVRSMQVQTSFHRMCWEDLGRSGKQRSNMFHLWCYSKRIKRCQSESQSICSFNGGLSTTKSDLKEQTVWNSQPVLLYPASC